MTFVKGSKTNLVEISENDADVIIELRNSPSINKFLSSSKKIETQEQIAWIRNNKAKADNFYFKITDLKNNFFGTISIYNITDNQGEFGRFISTSPLHAVEAQYLIIKFGFETLNLNRIYCHTVIDNKSVWNQHYKFGFVDNENFVFDGNLGVQFKIQEISREAYTNFDYGPILKLISRF